MHTLSRTGRHLGVVAILAMQVATGAHGAETGGCASFAWPLDTELAWMAASDPAAAESGATFPAPPEKAIDLKLQPTADVKFLAKPSGRAKSDGAATFAGLVTFDAAAKPGIYQVTLSAPGWIDVVQNGATLKPTAHSGKSDCPAMRKSVRFEIGSGPFTLQLSNVSTGSIKVAISPAR